MNGFFEFLDQFRVHLTGTIAGDANALLTTMVPWVTALLHLYIVIWGKNVAFREMSGGEFANRFVRAYLVIALMAPPYFNQFIVQSLTVDIPNQITQAVAGQGVGVQGTPASGFAALNEALMHFAATIRAQMVPPLFYVGDRIQLWLGELFGKGLIAYCYTVAWLAQIGIAFLLPVYALLGWTFLFRRTEHIGHAVVGQTVTMFLVLAGALMVSAVNVQMSANAMRKYGQIVSTQAPNPELSALNFTGFASGSSEVGSVAGPGASPQAAMANSANVDASMEMMWNLVLCFFFSAFIVTLITAVAMNIGRGAWRATPSLGALRSAAAGGVSRLMARA